jgi:alkaline phosphatase
MDLSISLNRWRCARWRLVAIVVATFLAGTLGGSPATASTPALAKNVILFITDGASWGAWDMASYWEHGRKGLQPYDRFSVKLGMTTTPLNTARAPTGNDTPTVIYDPGKAWDFTPSSGSLGGRPSYFNGYDYLKRDYTDSAAAATALAAGVQTYNSAINFDNFGRPLGYITQHAKALGKATGVVSSVPLSHATPAAFGAQNINRNHYGEISAQMVDNPALDLLMGAGHPHYDSNGQRRSTPRFANETGPGAGFISRSAWNKVNDSASGWQLIQSKSEFEALANGSATLTGNRLIGVPQVHDTLQYSRSGTATDAANPSGAAYLATTPTLALMTQGALKVLSRDPDGFFLMVEGGAVDWAAHANNTGRIIEEQMDFNRSVQTAVDWVNANSQWNETLIIVLTDHGNAMPMGPNSDRLAFEHVQNNGKGVLPGVKWHYGTHTNENTLLFAQGAGAQLFDEHVKGIDPGLVHIVGHNADGRYVRAINVFTVMQAAMRGVPKPAQ